MTFRIERLYWGLQVGIQDQRRSYDSRQLDLSDLHADPFSQFDQWYQSAMTCPSADWFEPNAMTLATADKTGRVAARIVLLKNYSAEGFSFFTNYDSDKAQQLNDNPRASMLLYWPHQERQVRIEGAVLRTDAAMSDEYFHSRPRGSQLSAVVSPQSREVTDRQELEQQSTDLAAQYDSLEIPRPEYWGGYTLVPDRLEFWQGRTNRLHDRFVYLREADSTWQIRRLAP